MTISGQVRHVMSKDLREARWLLAAYCAAVAIATLHSLSWAGSFSTALDSMAGIVVLLGMFVIALGVQADSPTRVDAFWATRPLAPSAVFGAKIVLLVVLLGLPMIGQLIGLRAHGVRVGSLPEMLWPSIWEYGVLLVLGMLAAALTPDVRSFVVAVVAASIIFLFLAAFFSIYTLSDQIGAAAPDRSAQLLWLVLMTIAIGGGVTLMAWLYRFRDARRRVWVAGTGCALCALGTLQGSPFPSGPVDRGAEIAPQASFVLSLVDPRASLARSSVELVLQTVAQSGAGRFVPGAMQAVFHLRDGTTLRALIANMPPYLHSPLPSIERGATWIGRTLPPTDDFHMIAVLTPSQIEAVATGVSSVDVTGIVQVWQPRIVGTMPLTTGATLNGDGSRTRIASWRHGFGALSLRLEQRSIPNDPRRPFSVGMLGADVVECALWHPARHEAIALARRGGQSGNAWLVLPGVSVFERTSTFEPETPIGGPAAPAVDDTWFDGARLVVVDWIQTGTFPLTARLDLMR